jgi:hypothetical protein
MMRPPAQVNGGKLHNVDGIHSGGSHEASSDGDVGR